GSAIHFCHVTTAESLNEILRAKTREGLRLSTEATPHHLFLSEEELRKLGGKALTLPPLRAKALADALWKETVKGGVDIIASDHAPHALEEKRGDSAWEISPGIPGLETTLPLLLTKVNLGEISLGKVVELLARRPSEIFNLKFKGELREGFDGDVTLISLRERHEIDSAKFHSKAKYSPFDGFTCVGKAAKTIVSGKLVMEDGEIIGKKGDGSIIGEL
ncbi:TPA: dihydroorotase, partial [Candidatus Bathyarchaeota archaeon]|nr:dihydroorotase [Candidatus Bathyarchaeota archaeon]